MDNRFFEQPVLNSPYDYPERHWELDDQGQPTQRIIDRRRRAEFITPIPKPRKRKKSASPNQLDLVFDEGKGISTQEQRYDPTPVINDLRRHVDEWRRLSNPADWRVTPETARLLKHWRHHRFSGFRPFFCQVEAAETAIYLTEVAPKICNTGKAFLNHLGLEVPYQYGSEMRTYLPDFIVCVDDGGAEPLHLVLEIKGFRREDAKEKKATMETYWVPGVNNHGVYGRWAFAEFTDAYQMAKD